MGPSAQYLANVQAQMELCDDLTPEGIRLVHTFGLKRALDALRQARTEAEAWDIAVKALGAQPVRV